MAGRRNGRAASGRLPRRWWAVRNSAVSPGRSFGSRSCTPSRSARAYQVVANITAERGDLNGAVLDCACFAVLLHKLGDGPSLTSHGAGYLQLDHSSFQHPDSPQMFLVGKA